MAANITVKVTRQSTGRREVARSLCMLRAMEKRNLMRQGPAGAFLRAVTHFIINAAAE